MHRLLTPAIYEQHSFVTTNRFRHFSVTEVAFCAALSFSSSFSYFSYLCFSFARTRLKELQQDQDSAARVIFDSMKSWFSAPLGPVLVETELIHQLE